MSAKRAPVSVGKRAYSRRRLADAARLIPVLGIGLFMFPLFWIAPGDSAPVRTVSVMFYLFIVWIGLAVASGLISRNLSAEPDATDPHAPGGAESGE